MNDQQLEQLQDLRRQPENCIGKISTVYIWAMNIAINAYIGTRGKDQAFCVEGLAKALAAEMDEQKQQDAA